MHPWFLLSPPPRTKNTWGNWIQFLYGLAHRGPVPWYLLYSTASLILCIFPQGAFLAASWVNGMLWAIELRQAFHFFTTYEHDGPWLRLAVTALLLSDSVASLAIFGTYTS